MTSIPEEFAEERKPRDIVNEVIDINKQIMALEERKAQLWIEHHDLSISHYEKMVNNQAS